jgi:hypothetical protein
MRIGFQLFVSGFSVSHTTQIQGKMELLGNFNGRAAREIMRVA